MRRAHTSGLIKIRLLEFDVSFDPRMKRTLIFRGKWNDNFLIHSIIPEKTTEK